jgi:hypothetical protein
LWLGEINTGLLLMRNNVEAACPLDAITKAIFPMLQLLDSDLDEFSFTVERL